MSAFTFLWSICLVVNLLIPVSFVGVNNGMSESLEKLMCDKLIDVLKSLFNSYEVFLSSLLDRSDFSNCFDCLSFENFRLSNALNTIFLPSRSTIVLLNKSSFISPRLELSNYLICFPPQVVFLIVCCININKISSNIITKNMYFFKFSKTVRFIISFISHFTSMSFFSSYFNSFYLTHNFRI